MIIYSRKRNRQTATDADRPKRETGKRHKMTVKTNTAIKAILAMDDSITQEKIDAGLEALSDALSGKDGGAEEGDRVLSRAEVAAMMGKSVKAVDIYGRRGVIRRVYLTGGGRQRIQSQGYSRNSVLEAMKRGRPTAAK